MKLETFFESKGNMVDEKYYRCLASEEIKRIELDLLIVFDRLCQDNDLYYVLCGGTLLGAIRHKGFIPWDDDIDVLMPRDDYDRLMNMDEIDVSSLPSYVEIASWKNNRSDYPFIKLVDRRTVIDSNFNSDSKTNHLWIDVFSIDGNPDSTYKLKLLFKKSRFYRKLLLLKMAKLGAGKTIIKRMLKPFVQLLLLPIDIKTLCRKIDKVAKTYSVEESPYIGGVLWGYGPCERINKEEFFRPVKVEFEGKMFNAPSNYDEYLSNLYGDYMKLPPETERKTHEMKAYMEN